ncbi:MAG TPA: flagellar export chaperone FliS [Nitrospiraceae bacterium]|nr:MAG: flagellar export chaperone FliS [Nitrospirae bacterium GWA2_46_11]OGW25957.1 MAG: flagellar export chaperone FliS [Nitrospirae bacterium GWB2_47_37]HAK87955.1 flagellar export chaperone FliS [Nitrospiraceae bacterium]HCL80757.1 flagellar export chaperone FliS [Nitrospiraceae bacterium]HCZ10851.1 flagellar export chaperone FliS [Nitrospiraceae bacterium]
MVIKNAAQQYKNNQISSAPPEETVLMLYNGAIDFLKKALATMGKDKRKKLIFIEKTIKIIDYMQSCLDMQKGEEIAKNLNGLYDYILIQLTKANLKNDAAKINEVIDILVPIRDAWAELCRNGKNVQQPASAGRTVAYGAPGNAEIKKIAVSA